jgi:M6 family metalloprotease-like protein
VAVRNSIKVDKWTIGIALAFPVLMLTLCLLISQSNAQSPSSPSWAATSVETGNARPGKLLVVNGQIEIIHQDSGKSGRYLYYLDTPEGGRIALHFSKHPPTNYLTGDHVSVRGRKSGATMILAAGSSVTNLGKSKPQIPPSSSLPNTIGAQSTLVILVNFQDAPSNQPYSVADADNLVFGISSNFFYENSYQQTWLIGDVVGWYTLPLSSTTCNIANIASAAQAAAAAAGVNLSAYTRYAYAFPQDNACGFAGSSDVGGNPSQTWINGTNSNSGLDLHVLDHELGHAFGLWHSHLLDCGTNATIGINCSVVEYGDILDTMGPPQAASPHYNAFQKERLGWLNSGVSPAITTVQSSGTYTIDSYESTGTGPKALKILKSADPTTGAKTWYYVEARQPIGFDAFVAYETSQNETSGVLVHIGTDGDGNSSDLLDMTPATPTYYWWFDPSLGVGQSFVDPTAGVTLTTEWVTSTEAAITVQFSGGLTVATDQSSYSPGQTVSTTATATYGGTPLANVSVSFTITKPNGSVVTGSANTGKNGTAIYKLRLNRNAPAGTYIAGIAAAVKGNPRSASTDFTVR